MTTDASVTDFFSAWEVYRAVIDNDCMEHRRIYPLVGEILQERTQPFTVLDLGCGDAAGTGPAMVGTAAARYVGVDSAAPALDFAARTLHGTQVLVDLRVQDMLEMVSSADEQFDVILASFALHHFPTEQKREFLRSARDRLAPGGEMLLVDVVRRDGETREAYLGRYETMVRTWPMDSSNQDRIIAHVTSFDFPEEVSTLAQWAPELGYAEAIEFYRGGSDTQAGWRLQTPSHECHEDVRSTPVSPTTS